MKTTAADDSKDIFIPFKKTLNGGKKMIANVISVSRPAGSVTRFGLICHFGKILASIVWFWLNFEPTLVNLLKLSF